VGALSALLFSTVSIAVAEPPARLLDAPRAAGSVGERYDGYAVVRGTASPETTALVDKVNAERRAVYTQRAQSEAVPIEAIGRFYAAEIIKAAPAGTWFLAENGEWSRK
jgi:hypothetical protein